MTTTSCLSGQPHRTELDRIYNEAGTDLALELSGLFREGRLNEDSFRIFLGRLPDNEAERTRIEMLLAGHGTKAEPDLSTRAGELAWAAALGLVARTAPPGTLRAHPIWRTLTRHPLLAGSLGAAARY